MASYEYGNLYALRLTVTSPFASYVDQTYDTDGYLIETESRRTAEYIGAWGTSPTGAAGREYAASRLTIMNELGRQGWVIHQELLVNAPGPDWMYDVFQTQVALGQVMRVHHLTTREMTRRLPAIGRSRATSAKRLGGVRLTRPSSSSSSSTSATA